MQYQESYFIEINKKIAPNFEFDKKGNLVGIKLPLFINKAERNILLSYLWKIQINRQFLLQFYSQIEEKVIQLRKKIEKTIRV